MATDVVVVTYRTWESSSIEGGLVGSEALMVVGRLAGFAVLGLLVEDVGLEVIFSGSTMFIIVFKHTDTIKFSIFGKLNPVPRSKVNFLHYFSSVGAVIYEHRLSGDFNYARTLGCGNNGYN